MRRIFPKGTTPQQFTAAAALMVQGLSSDRAWCVEVSEWKKPRTNQQNSFLWGVCYPAILEAGGEALAGWTREDIHEYMLGECFGWETIEGFGRKRVRPIKRSSKLNRKEFSDYLLFLETRCSEMGIVIPEPSYEQA